VGLAASKIPRKRVNRLDRLPQLCGISRQRLTVRLRFHELYQDPCVVGLSNCNCMKGAFSGPSGVPAIGEESICWLSYKGLHVKSHCCLLPHGRFGSDLSSPPQPDTVIADLWLHLMFESAPPGIGMAHFSQPCANTPNIEWQRPRWSRNPLHNLKHDLETRPLTRHKRGLLVAPNGTVQEIKGQDRGRELVISLANRPCWFAKIDLSRTDGYSLFGLVA
jgi:hypothetical protein